MSKSQICVCSICNKALKENKFSPSAWLNSFDQYRRCRKCKSMLDKKRREKMKLEDPEEYAEKNRQRRQLYKERYPEKYKEQRRRKDTRDRKNYPEKVYIKQMARSTLRNAKSRGLYCEMEQYQLRDWILKQKQTCAYCGSTLNQIKIFFKKSKRYFADRRLQIDRKNSKIGYKFNNLTLCCRVCNDHKSDFFKYEEFKIIAKKYIKKEINKKSK